MERVVGEGQKLKIANLKLQNVIRLGLLLAPWVAVFLLLRPLSSVIHGQVVDDRGPVTGARVGFKGFPLDVWTGADGRFQLTDRPDRSTIVATKDGYFIAGGPKTIPVLTLHRLPAEDNDDYAWVDPSAGPGTHQCANCHGEIFREWSASGHARSATNRRFLNLFDGSDWQGKKDVGWSLMRDHPDGTGVCAACHAPTVPLSDPAAFDLRQVKGVAAHGVHCDFCHKVSDGGLGKVGLTHGRFGMKLLRPSEGQLFFGPLPDVDRGEDVFAPLYRDSRYCASCHEGRVFGVPVYTTYSEWLASPAKARGQQCQDCHMIPTGKMTNIAPDKGGIERDSATLASHRMFAGSQEEMLRNCLKLDVKVSREPGGVRVEVEVKTEGVGHRVPTGFVDRNLVLVVHGMAGEVPAALVEGPTLPPLAGKELAGKAGKLFAKVLKDFDGHSPAPFWKAQPEPVDTRMEPERPDRSVYRFAPEADQVRVRLIHRKFWPEVTASKGWPAEEMVVEVVRQVRE